MLPDHLRGDDDGPICSDEEKEGKRVRSASTTGTDPDDYDRVMGVSSVSPHETAGFGEGDATDIHKNQKGVASNSGDIEETAKAICPPH